MYGTAANRPQSDKVAPNNPAASASKPAMPNLQKASVSMSSFIGWGVAVHAQKQRAVGFSCGSSVGVFLEESMELASRTDVAVQGPNRHRGGRIVAGLPGPGENEETRVHTAGLLESDGVGRELLEVHGPDIRKGVLAGAAEEEVGCVMVGAGFDVFGVGDLVFFVYDRAVGGAVAGCDVGRFVGNDEGGAGGFIVLVPNQDGRGVEPQYTPSPGSWAWGGGRAGLREYRVATSRPRCGSASEWSECLGNVHATDGRQLAAAGGEGPCVGGCVRRRQRCELPHGLRVSSGREAFRECAGGGRWGIAAGRERLWGRSRSGPVARESGQCGSRYSGRGEGRGGTRRPTQSGRIARCTNSRVKPALESRRIRAAKERRALGLVTVVVSLRSGFQWLG